jgi:large subunit ribosomal protein L23
MNSYQIVKHPIITEKSTYQKEKGNKYLFAVDKSANKQEIKKAIEELFKVKVEKVNTAIFPGKKRRFGVHEGYKPDWKKSVVTLKKGQSIELEEKR